MDIRCPICGEPWDMDEIHYEVEHQNPGKPWYEWPSNKYNQSIYDKYFQPMMAEFRKKGCEVFGCSHNEVTKGKNAAKLSGMLFDVLGDDIDGIASELEDAEYMGLI